MVMTWGDKHQVQYTDNVSYKYIPEPGNILLTNVIPVNANKKCKQASLIDHELNCIVFYICDYLGNQGIVRETCIRNL